MTYCVGLRPAAGLVMIADTRTNAGVDNISTYRKLHILADSDDRLIVIATAGSLSVTQSVISMVEEGLPPGDEGQHPRTLQTMPTMFRAAQLVGEAVTMARHAIDSTVEGSGVSTKVTLLMGGRIGSGPLTLYLIYGEGNFIECSPDSPYLQIGEVKYGKPMLDRTLHWDTPLDEAVKVGLISFDAAMRSNLSVGRPLDLVVIPHETSRPVVRRRIETDDAYFNDLSRQWGALMTDARNAIAAPPFMEGV